MSPSVGEDLPPPPTHVTLQPAPLCVFRMLNTVGWLRDHGTVHWVAFSFFFFQVSFMVGYKAGAP